MILTHMGHNESVYVTASLQISFFSRSSKAYVYVIAGNGSNTMTIVPQCACSVACVTSSVSCVVNADVTKVVSPHNGGTLMLTAGTNLTLFTGQASTCVYQGKYTGVQFALTYEVSLHPVPTSPPTSRPTRNDNSGPDAFAEFLKTAAASGVEFYVIVAFSMAYIALAVVLVRMRDKNKKVAHISLFTAIMDLAILGAVFTSEIFYVVVLLTSTVQSSSVLASIVILARVGNAIPTIYIVLRVFGPLSFSEYYGEMVDKPHLIQKANKYVLVIFLMLFDAPLARYLPWLRTDYSMQSNGYPDSHIFGICMHTKTLQIVLIIVVQIIVLNEYVKAHGFGGVYYALFILNLVLNCLLLLMQLLSTCIKARMLKGEDDHRLTDVEFGMNPMTDMVPSRDPRRSEAGGGNSDRDSIRSTWLGRIGRRGIAAVRRRGAEAASSSDASVVGVELGTRSRDALERSSEIEGDEGSEAERPSAISDITDMGHISGMGRSSAVWEMGDMPELGGAETTNPMARYRAQMEALSERRQQAETGAVGGIPEQVNPLHSGARQSSSGIGRIFNGSFTERSLSSSPSSGARPGQRLGDISFVTTDDIQAINSLMDSQNLALMIEIARLKDTMTRVEAARQADTELIQSLTAELSALRENPPTAAESSPSSPTEPSAQETANAAAIQALAAEVASLRAMEASRAQMQSIAAQEAAVIQALVEEVAGLRSLETPAAGGRAQAETDLSEAGRESFAALRAEVAQLQSTVSRLTSQLMLGTERPGEQANNESQRPGGEVDNESQRPGEQADGES